MISHAEEFALNFPGRPLLHHVQYLGSMSGADVDKFALASQQKVARAIEEKRFANSLFAVKNNDGSVALTADEHSCADTTLEGFGGLKAAFEQMGSMAVGPNKETLD